MNIALWLDRVGRSRPDAPALGEGATVIADYGTLARNTACRAGSLLHAHRLKPGDRVAIVAANTPRYVKLLWAIWHAGLVAVPVNARLHPLEIAWILEHSGARLAFVSAELETAIAAHLPPCVEEMIRIGSPAYRHLAEAEPVAVHECGANAPAWLFYTSGTTGRPKGATLTHANLAAMSQAYALEVDPIAPGDVLLHAAPMSHGSGLYMMAHVMRCGVNVVPESGGFDPGEIGTLARHWRNLSLFAAPTMVRRMVAHEGDYAPDAFRTIIYGGAPMYVEDCKAALDRFGPRLAQIYGQGESPMTITTLGRDEIADRRHPDWLARLASVGRPFACMEVAVVDDAGRHLPQGEIGEVICRGPTVMAGYWNDGAASAHALRDGWLRTGDLGSLDEAGYLTLKDRSKDLIISGGANIYPREVEEVLLTHPGIREACVIGRPDPEWGEIVVAWVVGEAPPAELDALCLARIARFKRPKAYRFVEDLPKNAYGKVLKTQLRERDRHSPAPD